MSSHYQLPAELISQIIHELVSNTCIEQALELRSVCKNFDFEVLRAILSTFPLGPRTKVKWKSLAYRLTRTYADQADGSGATTFDQWRRTVQWFNQNMPGTLDTERYLHVLCTTTASELSSSDFLAKVRKLMSPSVLLDQNMLLLQAAIVCGDTHILRRLSEFGVCITTQTDWIQALTAAACFGSLNTARTLLRHPNAAMVCKAHTQYDTEDVDVKGLDSALELATCYGHTAVLGELASFMLASGQLTTTKVVSLAQLATIKGHLPTLHFWLGKWADMDTYSSSRDRITSLFDSVFQLSAREGHLHIIKEIFGDVISTARQQINPIYVDKIFSATAQACFRGHVDVVHYLLHHGLEGTPTRWNRAAGSASRRSMDLLQIAASGGYVDVCQVLIDAGEQVKISTFEAALEHGQLDVLRWLNEEEVTGIFDPGYVSAQSLAVAVARGYVEAVTYTLSKLRVVPHTSHASVQLRSENSSEGVLQLFPRNLVLTATSNQQMRMAEILSTLCSV